jgi:hypothetical protein
MRVIQGIEQGTSEWHALRRGRVTGTKLCDVMGTPLARLSLIAELIAEEGTEQTKAFRATPEMERGAAEEAFAIRAYEKKNGVKVEKATMLISDEFDWLGISPDGLVKENGKYSEQLELKNPNSSTLILYKMANEVPNCPLAKKHFLGVPNDYKWQIVGSFLVNEDLERMRFVVYDARFINDTHKMYVVTIERSNPELQAALEEARRELIDFREEWLNYKDIVLPDNF